MLLKILQNLQKYTCARASFFNKAAGLRPWTSLKKRLRRKTISLSIFWNCLEHLIYRYKLMKECNMPIFKNQKKFTEKYMYRFPVKISKFLSTSRQKFLIFLSFILSLFFKYISVRFHEVLTQATTKQLLSKNFRARQRWFETIHEKVFLLSFTCQTYLVMLLLSLNETLIQLVCK